ncbi:MAG TPA: lasso peptide biosynthesis B2 protein [Anaerolineae bacterium]|nr:lasso peptide biosynthesis B2 protein [Anaerolineae bacterium]
MVWRRKLDRLRAEVRGWSDIVLLGCVAVLAGLLPSLLRCLSISAVMRMLTSPSSHCPSGPSDVERVVRLTDLVVKRVPLTRKTCLVRSLVLYRLLREAGMPVQIHFGVRKVGSQLTGHSWLTCQDQPVSEPAVCNGFTEIYTYPSETGMAMDETEKERSLCA